MTMPLIIWSCMVGLLLMLLVVRMALWVHGHIGHRSRFIEFGSERDMLYMPGDTSEKYEDDDCD